MKLKEFLRLALFYIGVPKCPSCGERLDSDDRALCKACFDEYLNFAEHDCSVCGELLERCTCTNKHLASHSVKALFKVVRYRPGNDVLPSNKLIYALKRAHRADVVEFISSEIAESLKNADFNPSECIFTNVPRRRAAVRQYGYDHSALLAKSLAEHFGAEYRTLLVSRATRAQKKLYGTERLRNAEFDYKGNFDLGKKSVIIVDDLVTTGASMGAAAMLLKMSGAGKIYGACFAIAYKDAYIPFKK